MISPVLSGKKDDKIYKGKCGGDEQNRIKTKRPPEGWPVWKL